MEITTPSLPLTAGENAALNCTSYLDNTRVEWEYNGVVVAKDEGGVMVKLTFVPVNDSIHDGLFTCKVYTRAGAVFTDSVTVTVNGKVNVKGMRTALLTCISFNPRLS